MKLYHYSKEPLAQVNPMRHAQPLHDRKPLGFWVSVGDGTDTWEAWCKAEQFSLDRLACRAEIVLAPGANVLRLTGIKDIDDFTRQYDNPPDWVRERPDLSRFGDYINWRKVAMAHDGIIIAPYIWARRLDSNTSWYYGWDCASGCIWNHKAIAAVVPLEMAA